MPDSKPAPSGLKRFYERAEAAPLGDLYAVLLDGKPLATPAGRKLRLPHPHLAEALAQEWHAQGERIDPFSMPLTRLIGTALDRVAHARGPVIDQMIAYAGTDLLCYRAEFPRELRERQETLWQPVLDWAEIRFGAALKVGSGVAPIGQPAESLVALRSAIEPYDDLRLTALADLVPALGSFLLGLAAAEGHLTVAEAFAASQIDENWQEEHWGEDFEATAHRERLRRDVETAGRLLELSSGTR